MPALLAINLGEPGCAALPNTEEDIPDLIAALVILFPLLLALFVLTTALVVLFSSANSFLPKFIAFVAVSYTHLTLPTKA